MPFGPVNAQSFYTAIIRRFQADLIHLFQLYCNNNATKVNQNSKYPKMFTPYSPRSDVPAEYTEGLFLPNFIINDEFVLQNFDDPCEPIVQETYTATTTVRQRITCSICNRIRFEDNNMV